MTNSEIKTEIKPCHPDTNGGNNRKIERLMKLVGVLRGPRCPVCGGSIASPARSPCNNASHDGLPRVTCSRLCSVSYRRMKRGLLLPLSFLLALLMFGCAVRPQQRKMLSDLPPLPPGPPETNAGPQFFGEGSLVSLGLEWEHNGLFTIGFTVERSTNLVSSTNFEPAGFVSVTNYLRNNGTNFTYRVVLTNEPPWRSFYRVRSEPTNGQPQQAKIRLTDSPPIWVAAFGAANTDSARCVVMDGGGNVWVAGNSAGNNFELRKYSRFGAVLWKQTYSGTIFPYGMSVDIFGNAYVVGDYIGTADFGGGNIGGSISYYSAFIASYNPSGAHRWSKGYVGVASDNKARGAAVADVLWVGGWGYQMDFGGGLVLNGIPSGTPWLARINPDTGTALSLNSFGLGIGGINGLAADNWGNIAATGYFYGTIVFGATNLTATGYAGFVSKLTGSGAHIWSRAFDSFTSPAQDSYNYGGVAVACSLNGDTAVTGGFNGSINLGGDTFTANPSSIYDPYVGRWSQNGTHKYSRHITSTTTTVGRGNAVAFIGEDLVCAGTFYGTADFGSGHSATSPGASAYMVRYDQGGTTTKLDTALGANAAALTTSGGVTGGKWSGSVTMNGQTFNSFSGTLDAFIWKP